MYKRLEALQDRCIPRLFGKATVYKSKCEKVPALLFQFVHGTSLYALPLEMKLSDKALEAINQGRIPEYSEIIPDLTCTDACTDTLQKRVWHALHIHMRRFRAGVLHGDPKLDNFIWCNDGLVTAVDFSLLAPSTAMRRTRMGLRRSYLTFKETRGMPRGDGQIEGKATGCTPGAYPEERKDIINSVRRTCREGVFVSQFQGWFMGRT